MKIVDCFLFSTAQYHGSITTEKFYKNNVYIRHCLDEKIQLRDNRVATETFHKLNFKDFEKKKEKKSTPCSSTQYYNI